MSTRATIFVEVPDEMIGKKVKFSMSKFYHKQVVVDDYGKPCKYRVVKPKARPAVKLDHKYVGCFVHWDGYPCNDGLRGAGVELMRYCLFDTVLNLVLGGLITWFEGDMVCYHIENCIESCKNSGHTAPSVADEFEVYKVDDEPCVSHEYVYLFRTDGQWYVKGHNFKEWTPVKEVIGRVMLGEITEEGYEINDSGDIVYPDDEEIPGF